MLEYKLKRYGIRFIKQEESYTSQCSPLSPEVGKRYAEPSNRKERGSYRDGNRVYNEMCIRDSQIMAAFGLFTETESPEFREGVKRFEDKKTDIFFINLNKSEKDFSPSTMYELSLIHI